MVRHATVCRRLTPADRPALEAFFSQIVACGADGFFHPHPFTPQAAARICGHADESLTPRDEYHAVLEDGRIIAYGMLRGWREGYAIPSLGIAVLPECRRRGIARQLMHHLHEVAADRGAASVRLTVYRENRAASMLYESFGYRLTPCSDHELVGHLSLSPTSPRLISCPT